MLSSVVQFLCGLCHFSDVEELLDDLESAVYVIPYKQVIFSATQLLIPESLCTETAMT